MHSEVGIDPQSLPYGLQNEIMYNPCSNGGLGNNMIGYTKFNEGCIKFLKDVLNFVKDVPNFVKDVPRVPKCIPRWGSADSCPFEYFNQKYL